MRALVVGGDGKIGRVLCDRLQLAGHSLTFTSRAVGKYPHHYYPDDRVLRVDLAELDLREPVWPLTDAEDHLEVVKAPPPRSPRFSRPEDVAPPPVDATKVVYLVAAITGIMRCETDPDAWRVNAEAPAFLARQARARGWHVVFISSGTVERASHTASARQKSYADLAVLMLGGCVVRPLPAVPPEKYVEFADLLVRLGEEERAGLVRWEG